ncbi:MAG: alpha/beta hydrolase [Nitriliruptoraceae bacterium]|nr:alpha/beta hydrolase [Nitriliruptoraceae bacterium]
MWSEEQVEVGGVRLHVRTSTATLPDDAPVALLLHGWPQDGSCWEPVATRLETAGYRVVAPDLKGFGRSDAPRRGYDAATLADEISQLIRWATPGKALLVGHDWGGALALATAFRHPGRVQALVTASSPFRQIDLTAAWHIPLFNVPLAPQLVFKIAGTPLTKATIRYASENTEVFDDEAYARYGAAVRAAPRGWLAYYRTLSRGAVIDWSIRRIRRRASFLRPPDGPHRLRVPTTVVWGGRDRVTPVHLATRVAHDLDAELEVIEDVGHFVHEEAPQAFTDAVLRLATRVDFDEDGGVAGPRPERTRTLGDDHAARPEPR